MGGLDQAFVDHAERQDSRKASVLVARISGNVKPAESSYEESRLRCLNALVQAAEISGGRVLRQQRDTLMVLLGSADAAVAAATRMQAYATSDGRGHPYGIRIGLASGPVTQRDHDVLGDTVNLALQFSRDAQSGQILTSNATASNLSPAVQRTLGLIAGTGDPCAIRDLPWRQSTQQLLAAQKEAASFQPSTMLRLEYCGKVLLRRRELEFVTFGRDVGSHVVVPSRLASRRHCTVSRHEDAFVLQDHSRNGTFLMIAGEGEFFVHADAARLGKEGWISPGQSGDCGDDIVQYKVLLAK